MTSLDDPIPAIGYIRVSMAREEMISPELQRTSIETWARRNNRRIVEWVEDLDATGRNFKRKIIRAISYIETGAAKEIAVWKYSRFGRNRHGNINNLERVERAGGQLESATEQVDARTAFGRFQRGILFEVAVFESERAGEQWKETHDWRRKNGLPSGGGERFGYIWHRRRLYEPDGTIRLQAERYEPDPKVAPAVREIFEIYAEGRAGFDSLARYLNALGLKTTRGYRWHGESLRHYMDSGFAAGYLRVHSPNCHCDPYLSGCPNHMLIKVATKAGEEPVLPAIISEELWAAYVARRNEVRSLPPRARRATGPFTGVTKCALCLGSAIPASVKPYLYLQCNNRRKLGSVHCQGVRARFESVEEQLLTWLRRIASEIEREGSEPPTRKAAGLHMTASEARKNQAQELNDQKARLERAVAKHMRAYALLEADDDDGALEREFRETLATLRQEKQQVESQIAKMAPALAAEERLAEARAAAAPVVAGLLDEWHSLSPEMVNALLRKLVRRIEINRDKSITPVPTWEQDPRA
ncbi:recombinase family protein [Kitasatospora sp. NPDC059408]|uniref:recombinase family protein n=1 Tax=Kitasatospora sp. NPDC059408 TaxID=3346823 RepID=UPI0036903DB4